MEPQRSRRLPRLDIHPIGPRLLVVAGIAAALLLVAIFAVGRFREDRVDTWSGPDPAVRSGFRLAGCDLPGVEDNGVFPGWISYGGRVYRWADLSAPITDSSIPDSYQPTDEHLGDLRIYLIQSSPGGRNLERILVRNADANAGAVYIWVPSCVSPT